MFSKTFYLRTIKCARFLRSKPYENVRFVSASPESNDDCIEDKIIYNSILHRLSYTQRKMYERKVKSAKPLEIRSSSYALKFLSEYSEEPKENRPIETVEEVEIQLPFSKGVLKTDVTIDESENVENLNWEEEILNSNASKVPSGKVWMNDYEKYSSDDNGEGDSSLADWGFNYGTCNESVPVSRVPCGGCGAHLHCQNFSIPGFIPYEIFKRCNDSDLRALTCQRCHFLKHYDTALSISVDPESYPKLLSKIKNEKAMVLLLVDLTDFPCSIWPGILDVIGRKRPIFLVGNKVDLLWGDSKGWMNHVIKVLRSSLGNANVAHVQLISAKTGFGVEELITKLHNIWAFKGDVYLVGCTNVGKSTLFNALLQSDYCKVKARDLVQRATTSPWPGTTLNLLKFPILNPLGWRLFLRTQRLMKDRLLSQAESKLKKEQIYSSKVKPKSPLQIMGHIGMTFHPNRSKEIDTSDPFSVPNRMDVKKTSMPESGLDPNDKDYESSRWFHDTPGVLHPAQNLDLLTTEEIVQLLPKNVIEPRTYQLKPGWTLFLGGLARIDLVKGDRFIRCTVFSSKVLPVTICRTVDADQIYNELVGTDKMGIPLGRGERLKSWPHLSCGEPLVFSGINEMISCGDIVLSSSGWISITPHAKELCTILPWTPHARGIFARAPSLLPNAVNLRGKKIHKTPAYNRTKVFNND